LPLLPGFFIAIIPPMVEPKRTLMVNVISRGYGGRGNLRA